MNATMTLDQVKQARSMFLAAQNEGVDGFIKSSGASRDSVDRAVALLRSWSDDELMAAVRRSAEVKAAPAKAGSRLGLDPAETEQLKAGIFFALLAVDVAIWAYDAYLLSKS